MSSWSPSRPPSDPDDPADDADPTDAGLPRATAGRRSLRCYACNTCYDHLGRESHPGRCPGCGARGVSPAGRLVRLGSTTPVAAGPGDSTHRVDAGDDTDRTFTYWLSTLPGGRAQLLRVGVVDVLVGPAHDAWPDELDLVPGWIDRAAAEAGLELVAPAPALD